MAGDGSAITAQPATARTVGSPVISLAGETMVTMVATARVRRSGVTLYTGAHQALRKRRVAAYRPGDPCAIGGEPLAGSAEYLDLAHDDVNGGYLPGLSCRYHNRSTGAAKGNRQRGPLPRAQRKAIAFKTRRWK